MTRTSEKDESSGYIPSLDGIRAVAVAIVILAHAGYGDLVPGGLGVSIFFFLSGYLITTLFYREIRQCGQIDLRAFYLRRLLRLSPPLVVSLAVGYGLLAVGLARGSFNFISIAAQLFYAANYFQLYGGAHRAFVDGQSVLWSLAVEEHFYLIYPPLFIWLLKRQKTASRIAPMLGLLLLGLVWRAALITFLPIPRDHTYYATDSRLDSILFGCLLAVASQEGAVQKYMPKTRRHAVFAQVLACVLLLCTLLYRDEFFRETLRYTLQGIALVPLFYYAVHMPELALHRPLNWRPLQKVGVYSYSVYLLHHVIIESLREVFDIQTPWQLAAIGGSLSLGYAALIFRYVEKPMLGMRRRLHAKIR